MVAEIERRRCCSRRVMDVSIAIPSYAERLFRVAAGSMPIAFPSFGQQGQRFPSNLDLAPGTSQTRIMAHSYIKLDFGTDEEKAQQARHKLDVWKQAFRLDKRLLCTLDRPETDAGETVSKPEPVEKPAPASQSTGKTAVSPKAKSSAKESEPGAGKPASAPDGHVTLLVTVFFSYTPILSQQL